MHDLLRIENLEKRYPGFTLSGITLGVPAGCVVGLVGGNGAGKTTTLRAALGTIQPDAGSIRLFGEEIVGAPESRVAELKQDVGVVLDACLFPGDLTVAAVGRLVRAAYRAFDPALFASLIERFALPLGKQVKDLSRGMGMKLSLACALSHRPRLLVLDEATAGLDPIARDEVLDLLRGEMLAGDRGILLASHITSDLEKTADYIVCIDEGRVAFSCEKDAICDRAGIAQLRAADLDAVRESGFFAPDELRYARDPYGTRLLVPDRIAFAKRFPHIEVERADIDSYLHLMLGK